MNKITMKQDAPGAGLGFFGLLQAAFIFCKVADLTAIADWSWWWVLSPMLFAASLVWAAALLFLAGAWMAVRAEKKAITDYESSSYEG